MTDTQMGGGQDDAADADKDAGGEGSQEAADRMGTDDSVESGAGYGNHATGYEDDPAAGTGSDQR